MPAYACNTSTRTITDNATARYTINDVPVTEGACFFFNDTATTEIYTLSLHDALPISDGTTSAGDFDHTAGVAHFAANSTTSQPVTVAITDDNIVEANIGSAHH